MTKNFLWIVPFFSFILGYILLSIIISKPDIQTPSLLGITLNEASKIIARSPINISIRSIAIDDDLPAGTIISQSPGPGQSIKAAEPMYVIVTQKKAPMVAPEFLLLKKESIYQIAHTLNLSIKEHKIDDHRYAINSCIGQFPAPQTLINQNEISIYVAQRVNKPVLMPNLKGKKLEECKNLFEAMHLQFLVHSNADNIPTNLSSLVVDHWPRAGSLITLQHETHQIQLLI